MKKLFLAILCVGFVAFSISGNAFALSYNSYGDIDYRFADEGVHDYTGEYLFTVGSPKNDNPQQWTAAEKADLIALINDEISPTIISSFELYGKDNPAGTDPEGQPIGVSTSDGLSGSWETLDGKAVEFYTVKAANEWALYWIDGGTTQGDWTTKHVENKGGKIPTISHLSLWNAETGDTPPVPEPSTVFLLGLGLLGVLGLGRKIKK